MNTTDKADSRYDKDSGRKLSMGERYADVISQPVTDSGNAPRNFPVKIHDLTKTPTLVYIARFESHCHDPIDAEAFRLCRRFNDVITLGKVIAEPALNL